MVLKEMWKVNDRQQAIAKADLVLAPGEFIKEYVMLMLNSTYLPCDQVFSISREGKWGKGFLGEVEDVRLFVFLRII